jgi:hypothetical protein
MADLLSGGFPTADVFAGQRLVGRPAGLTAGRAYLLLCGLTGLGYSMALVLSAGPISAYRSPSSHCIT